MQRGVQIFANTFELRRPRRQWVRLAGVQHVAHRQPDRVQIVLYTQQLQRVSPVPVDHFTLQFAQTGKLHPDVKRVRHHGGERDDQPEEKPRRRRALRRRWHEERIPQADAWRRTRSNRNIIATANVSGTSKPTLKLPACTETNPTNHGPKADPTDDMENINPPRRTALAPYQRESHET